MTTTTALNLFASACNILSAFFIVLLVINIRRATKVLTEWGDMLRAASCD